LALLAAVTTELYYDKYINLSNNSDSKSLHEITVYLSLGSA